MNEFENITIEGIGNLAEFDSVSVKEIQSRIDACPKYALYMATATIPNGWPKEVMQAATAIKEGELHPRNLNQWYMNITGSEWKLFYSFDLDAYLAELQLCPAFIYEKTALANSLISYKPIVSMLIAEDGCIAQASKSLCDTIIASL